MNSPFRTHELLPYGQLFVDDQIILLHRARASSGLNRYALGVMWEVTPLDIDLLSESEIERAADDVKSLLISLPRNSILDVRMDSRPITDIPEWNACYEDRHSEDVELMRQHISKGMPHQPGASLMRLTECRVTIGFRMPVSGDEHLVRQAIDLLKAMRPYGHTKLEMDIQNRLSAIFGEQYTQFLSVVVGIERSLQLLDLAPKRLSPAEWVSAINRAAGPTATELGVVDSNMPIGEQVKLPYYLADDDIRTDTHRATVYTLERAPGKVFAGILGAARTPEVGIHGLRFSELSAPISIVVTIHAAVQEQKQSSLSIKHAFAALQTVGMLGERRPETAKQASDLGDLIASMTGGSEHVYDAMVTAILWHPIDSVSPDELFKKMSLDMLIQWYREPFIASTIFLRSLPLGCDWGFPNEKMVRRSRQLITRTLARLVPLWGSFRGTKTPTAVYVNQLGQPVFFDLFDRPGTPHVTIVGKSRRGKSAFLNTYISQAQDDYLIYVLDRYGSYDEMARRRKGRLLKFGSETPICLGPMDGPLDINHRQHMAIIIEEMAGAGFRDTHVTPDERTMIGDFVSEWANKGPMKNIMSDFAGFLEDQTEPFAANLVRLLGPYYGNGRYAAYIDGPNELGIEDSRFWVGDVAGLENYPELQSITITTLFGSLERHITREDLRDTRKILAADEVSFLIRNPQAAEFLCKLAVALARFFCSFVLISQSMSDFLTDLGSATVKQADCHVFFNLGRQELSEIAEIFKLDLHTQDSIVALRRYSDCSEAVIRFEEGEGGSGVIRVVPPPAFIQAIGQTEEHRQLRAEIEREG